MKLRCVFTLLILVAIPLLSAAQCGSSTSAQQETLMPSPDTEVDTSEPAPSPDPDEIVVVVQEEPYDLGWHRVGLSHIPITRNTYEPLVTRNGQTGVLEPALAESWEQIDNNTWRFKLREGVTFHNGQPFDAAAAVWNINTLTDPNLVYHEGYTSLSGQLVAEAIDTYTIEVKTEDPEPILPRLMYWLYMTSPQVVETDPEFQTMIGTGAYKLAEWNKGESIVLVANSDYWGGEPTVKKVTFIWRTDSALRAAMVGTGQADIGMGIDPQSAASIQVVTADIPETPLIRIDPNPPLDDLRVRQAICMAMDREYLVDEIFAGFAKPASQIISPDVIGYNPDLSPFTYDPDGARALIEAARADGVPVDLELTIYGREGFYPNAKSAMEEFQLWLAEIGLSAKIEMLSGDEWRIVYTTQPIPQDRRALVQSSHGNEAGDGILTLNGYYRLDSVRNTLPDPQMEQLIDAAAPLSGEARQKAIAAALAYHHDHLLSTCPMVHMQAVWGVSERVEWTPRIDNLILVKTVSVK